jgi:hypothetical protein
MATSINFPSSPTPGQTYNYGIAAWTWDGSAWKLFSSVNIFGDPVAHSLNASTNILNDISSNRVTVSNNLVISSSSFAPTAPVGTDSNQIATTSFVLANSSSFNYAIKTTNYTAVAKDGLFCDTTLAPFTVTLPANPLDNNSIFIADAKGTFAANPLTINGNGKNIMNDTTNLILNNNNVSFTLIYKTNLNWRII